MSPNKRVLVSACLVGWHVRYNGGSKFSRKLLERARADSWSLVPVCPEVLGGLSVPRERAFIECGNGHAVLDGSSRVLDARGRDVSRAFILGARKVIDIARKTGCTSAILMDNSPSCSAKGGIRFGGNHQISMESIGVTAALLIREKFTVEGWSE